jgi:spore maturation protein CgeB
MEISPASLKHVKQSGVKLVGYNPDNPFVFTGKGSGNSNVTDSISLYDMHFTYNRSIQKKLQSDYGAQTFFLPFGFQLDDTVYEECVTQPETLKMCFLGNHDTDRVEFLNRLAEAGISIDVYGNDWNKVVSHPNISVFPPVYGKGFWMTLRRYRVQLNLMRVHNPDSHNMRTFEVPGVGGIMLAPNTQEHRTFFDDGKEAFLFNDVNHCILQAKHLLSLSETEAGAIRDHARTRSLTSGYTYKDRAKQALAAIEAMIENEREI